MFSFKKKAKEEKAAPKAEPVSEIKETPFGHSRKRTGRIRGIQAPEKIVGDPPPAQKDRPYSFETDRHQSGSEKTVRRGDGIRFLFRCACSPCTCARCARIWVTAPWTWRAWWAFPWAKTLRKPKCSKPKRRSRTARTKWTWSPAFPPSKTATGHT